MPNFDIAARSKNFFRVIESSFKIAQIRRLPIQPHTIYTAVVGKVCL